MGNFHCSTNRIPRGLPRGYSFNLKMIMESISKLPEWLIIVIAILALFDSVLKLIALWKSARNNHLVWFICLAIFNTMGILPIVYLILNKNKAIPKAE